MLRDTTTRATKKRPAIRTPQHLSRHEEIISELLLAHLEERLELSDAPRHCGEYFRAVDRMFPTKYAKFGGGPLLSLGEALFGWHNKTADSVIGGLWD